jgi:hypothetical protein
LHGSGCRFRLWSGASGCPWRLSGIAHSSPPWRARLRPLLGDLLWLWRGGPGVGAAARHQFGWDPLLNAGNSFGEYRLALAGEFFLGGAERIEVVHFLRNGVHHVRGFAAAEAK